MHGAGLSTANQAYVLLGEGVFPKSSAFAVRQTAAQWDRPLASIADGIQVLQLARHVGCCSYTQSSPC